MGLWPFGGSHPHDYNRDTTADQSLRAPSELPPVPPDDDDDDDNPFIVFRRAVDDQFRLMATGLASVPSILHELQVRGESESRPKEPGSRWTHGSFTDRAEQPLAFMSQHFQSPSLSAGAWRRGPPPSEEALAAARTLLLQSRDACAKAGLHTMDILSLYRDPESGHPFFPSRNPPWLSVRWFNRSIYSPAQLETHPLAHQHGSMWRAAFEDLLCASTGREPTARDAWTGAREDQKLYSTWAQTPRDWMLGLQCRGVLPPQLPALYHLGSTEHMDHVFSGLLHGLNGKELGPFAWGARRDFIHLAREIGTFDADEQRQCDRERRPRRRLEKAIPSAQAPAHVQSKPTEKEATELDAYEHFLGKVSANSEPQTCLPSVTTPAIEQHPQPEPAKQPSQPISTLSTTERTTHPDGTITTKVMVRKVFADGSEQVTESESTTLAQKSVTVQNGQQGGPEASKEKSGWFWH